MNVKLHPGAEDEFVAQVDFYESRQPGLGERFARAIYATFERLIENPGLGKPAGERMRQLSLQQFPHSVIYQHGQHGLFVLAIAHQKRRSGYWRNRSSDEHSGSVSA
ncbi:plasmid stabilization system [Salinisphaera sp. T5B8]|uniref:type II toxin-antitoxin system RelE/ParE family toxin n=1 Tax=Salinisphaera sp. T5B8 TaxID=1304154 RepID=UPI0033400AF6